MKRSYIYTLINYTIRTWPTRVLMSVFLSRLSLCSVTRIWCLMISADVMGRLGLAAGGTVKDMEGLPCPPGEEGFDPLAPPLPPAPDTILLDGDRPSIFNPSALFTRLVGVITTTAWAFVPIDPSPLLSWWFDE